MFRYWDGRSWSASVTHDPRAAPPPGAVLGSAQAGGTPLGSAYQPGNSPYGTGTRSTNNLPKNNLPKNSQGKKKFPLGWVLGLVAVLAVIIVLVAFVLPRALRSVGDGIAGGGNPTTDVCPAMEEDEPEPQPGDGRVHGGNLSYPQLGVPWSAPGPESKVAFGRGVLKQSVKTEQGDNLVWEAAVLIGDLVAGDGFFGPKDGAEIVLKCVSGTFYGPSEVTRDDQQSKALTIDGHDAWVIETWLSFDVPSIKAKKELVIIVVVSTGTGSAGLFYASLPETNPELFQPARDALAGLQVKA